MVDVDLDVAPIANVFRRTPFAAPMGRDASGHQWNRLFFDLVTALAPTMPNTNPQGLCHLAAEIADAAFEHRRIPRS